MKKNVAKPLSPRRTILRFSPYAWAKLLYLRDAGNTEIGGFGIAPQDDLLFVEDIRLVKQHCTWASADFDDQSVADFFEEQVDEGRRPQEFFRLFIHTHPGASAQPSATDEETFTRVFGRTDWAVMFILARHGQCFARLRYNVGPGLDAELPVEVDYGRPFENSDWELWQAEYLGSVTVSPPDPPQERQSPLIIPDQEQFTDEWWRDAWGSYADFDDYRKEERFEYYHE